MGLAAAAQERSAFEVASVKSAQVQGQGLRINARVDADGVSFTNMALRGIIQRAYNLKPYQMVGPDWITGARYVIVAKAAGPAPQEKLMEMLQTLLADRFKLAFHRETRDMPGYALVVAKGGPKLKEITDDGPSEIDGGDGDEINFGRIPMGMLVNELVRSLGRPVLDQTGLKGRYTFKLAWAVDRPGGRGGDSGEPSQSPSIFTALQERLGLKLEPRRTPVEMFVVDHVERSTEN
jgi:uncharacterized protein (TIGR03435 family)